MKIRNVIISVVAASALAAPVLANRRDRAILAISQAQDNIQLAASAGAGTWAAETQAQAGTALERARQQMGKGHKRHAFYAAREADAYARLALAKAQNRTLATPASY